MRHRLGIQTGGCGGSWGFGAGRNCLDRDTDHEKRREDLAKKKEDYLAEMAKLEEVAA